MGVQGGGGIFGGGGHSSSEATNQTTTETVASTGQSSSSGSDNQQLSGITLSGSNPTLTLTDQGSLRAAFSIVSEAFKSIDTNTHDANAAFDKSLNAVSGAYQNAASQAVAGGTFDTQKVIMAFLGVGAIIAVAVIFKK